MAAPMVGMKVMGSEAVIQGLRQVPRNMVTKHTRRALYQGAVVIRDAARPAAPKLRGFLRRALVVKAGVVRGEARASVGVARVWFLEIGTTKTGKARWKRWAGKVGGYKGTVGRRVRPSRYAHLMEFGWQHGHARAFLGPAVRAQKARVMQIIQRELRKGLSEETRRAQAKRRK